MINALLGSSKYVGENSNSSSSNKSIPYVALGLAATAVACTVFYQNHRRQNSTTSKSSSTSTTQSISKPTQTTPYTVQDGSNGSKKAATSTSSSAASSANSLASPTLPPGSSPFTGTRIPSFSRLSTVHEQQAAKGDSSSPGVGDNHTWTALGLEQPLVIAMVGLPARGKSYLVKMIIRYLKWTGFECQVFNVGSFRRQVGLASADSNFFDNSNPNNQKIREHLAMMVQDSMYKWLHATNEEKRRVAVFDATNTTKERRYALAQRAESENVFLLFVESICDDQEVLKKNYELKLQNDDYKGMDINTARRDFISRVKQYERVYETITDDENNGNIAYIKLINVGQKVITRNCHGYLPSQVAFYLQNVHINPRKIYLSVICQTSQACENVSGAESGDLTEDAKAYVNALADFMIYEQEYDLVEKGKEILVLTGTAGSHEQSVEGLKQRQFRVYHTPILNELRGGDLHGLSKSAMKALYPVEYEKRMSDKLNYRYPGVGGESYLDVIERVRPVIIELERQRRSLLIVCNIAVLRCIYAYFMGVPLSEIPFKEFKYHHIYELEPGPFGCTCTIIQPHLHSDMVPDMSLPAELGSPMATTTASLPATAAAMSTPATVAPLMAQICAPTSRSVSRSATPRPSVILETQYHSMQNTNTAAINTSIINSNNMNNNSSNNTNNGSSNNSGSVSVTPPRAIVTTTLTSSDATPTFLPMFPVDAAPSSSATTPTTSENGKAPSKNMHIPALSMPTPAGVSLLAPSADTVTPPPPQGQFDLATACMTPGNIAETIYYLDETTSSSNNNNNNSGVTLGNPMGAAIERVTNSFEMPRGRLGSYDGNHTPRLEASQEENHSSYQNNHNVETMQPSFTASSTTDDAYQKQRDDHMIVNIHGDD